MSGGNCWVGGDCVWCDAGGEKSLMSRGVYNGIVQVQVGRCECRC